MTNNERVHWLDGARAFLIVLGVLLHASRIYDTSGAWLVHGAGGFLPRRFVRIGVPMVATALTLNLYQDWMLFAHEAGDAALPAYLASERFAAFWRAANWQSHLWFLHYLLAYSCLA